LSPVSALLDAERGGAAVPIPAGFDTGSFGAHWARNGSRLRVLAQAGCGAAGLHRRSVGERAAVLGLVSRRSRPTWPDSGDQFLTWGGAAGGRRVRSVDPRGGRRSFGECSFTGGPCRCGP